MPSRLMSHRRCVGVLDCVALLTTIAGTLLAMLQDRKRPVWPAFAAMIPFVALGVLQILFPEKSFTGIAGTPNTAHSTNPVPFIYVTANKNAKVRSGILADVAPSVLHIMGLQQPCEMTGQCLISE